MNSRIPRNVHSFFYLTKFWPILLIIWVVTIILGYVGLQQSGFALDDIDRWYTAYRLGFGVYPGDSINESLLLNIIRFFAPFLMFATVLIALQKMFYESARRRVQIFMGGHTIICGMGSIGIRYIKNYLSANNLSFIVIESNRAHPDIQVFREEGAQIIIGDATNPATLEKAGIHTAKNLIAAIGSDAKNAIIASLCEQARAENPAEFICSSHITNPFLYNLLQAKWYRKRLSTREDEISGNKQDHVKLEPFNVFNLAGILILEKHPPFMAGDNPVQSPHILIISGGKLGEAIIHRLPHLWQITPGYTHGKRYKVTLVDRMATELTRKFCKLYPVLSHHCDITPVDIEVGSADFFSLDFLFDENHQCPFNIIYICLFNYEDGLYSALEIDEALQAFPKGRKPDIVIRTLYAENMDHLSHEAICNKNSGKSIFFFPLIDQVCSTEFAKNGILTEVLARAAHECYYKTCRDRGEAGKNITPFDKLGPYEQKQNRDQVRSYPEVLDQFGYIIRYRSRWDIDTRVPFTSEEIEKMAEIEHNRWWEAKKRDKKTNGCGYCKPYSEIDFLGQERNRDIFRNLNLTLGWVNMKVVRKDTPSDSSDCNPPANERDHE